MSGKAQEMFAQGSYEDGGRPQRHDLVVSYRGFVQRLARYLIETMAIDPELEDEMISAGYLGLVEAAQRYRYESPRFFRRFAFLRIKGAMIDALRKHSELSSAAYRYARALRAVDEIAEESLTSEKFEDRDLAPDLRLAQVLNYAAKGALAYRLSYAECEEDLPGNPQVFDNPEYRLSRKQHGALIRRLVTKLPPRERVLIEEYYFRELTFSETTVAKEGASKSWVSRIHTRALELLKELYVEASGCEP